MFRYYAFISYCHKDARFAQWLHRHLESFRLPANISNPFVGGNRFLRPIFRDKDDLDAGVLNAALQEKLKESKFLIVICSRNSAQSVWVNKEVQSFIDSGRYANIIPLMLEDGVDCLPQSLKDYKYLNPDQELLGVSVSEVGKDKALIRIVSKMLGVSFDSLWKRDIRQRKRKRILMAAVAGSFVLLISSEAFTAVSIHQRKLADEYDKTVRMIRSNLASGNLTEAEEHLNHIHPHFVNSKEVLTLKTDAASIRSHNYYPAYAFSNQLSDISEDGKFLSLVDSNVVEIRGIPGFPLNGEIVTSGDKVYYAAFTRDCKSIITVSHKYTKENKPPFIVSHSHAFIQVWDVRSGKEIKTIETGFYNPDNGIVITSDYDNHYLAIIDGQKIRYYLAPGDNQEESLDVMAKDRLCVWDLKTGEQVVSRPLNGEVTVTPHFINYDDHTALILKYGSYVDPSQKIGSITLQGGRLSVMDDDDRSAISDSAGPSAYNSWCWRPGIIYSNNGKRIPFIPGKPISKIKANRDASVLLTDSNVWLRNSNGDTVSTTGLFVSSLSLDKVGRNLAFISNGLSCIFDTKEGIIKDTISVNGFFQLCEDSNLLVCSGDGPENASVSILDLETRESVVSFTPTGFVNDDYPLFHFSISSDMRYCSALGSSGKLCVYDTRSGMLLYKEPSFARSARNVSELRYVSDFIPGTHILAIVGTYIQLFDVDKRTYISKIGNVSFENGTVPHILMVSPNGSQLMLDQYDHTCLFDLSSGRMLREIPHSDIFSIDGRTLCCFNSDSSMLLLSSPNYSAVLLDLRKGKEVKVIEQDDLMAAFFVDDIPFVMIDDQLKTM